MTAAILPAKTPEVAHREWHIIPDASHPNHFTLETATGNVLCTLAFPKNENTTNTEFLNLIASAPELQDIAEMYRDTMIGNRAEKTMIYTIVSRVLSRLQ